MISNDVGLIAVADEVSEKLQAINDYLGNRNYDGAKIRFPRGYLRSCAHHRSKYCFLSDKTLKSNIAYANMTTDIFRWLLNRTDLALTAKEMIVKQGISLMGSVAETIVKERMKGKPGSGRKQNFGKRVESMRKLHIIDKKLESELCWLWDMRNRIHLMLLTEPEYNKYKIKHYNRAVIALRDLRIALGGMP